MHSVIICTFPLRSLAEAGLHALELMDRDRAITLCAAAVAEQGEQGEQGEALVHHSNGGVIPDAAEDGLFGSLTEMLGGPLEVLIGGTSGAFAGSVGNLHRNRQHMEMLAAVVDTIPPGAAAVLAELYESDPAIVDAVLSQIGGTTIRHPAGRVDAENNAARQLGRTRRNGGHAQRRDTVRQILADPVETARRRRDHRRDL